MSCIKQTGADGWAYLICRVCGRGFHCIAGSLAYRLQRCGCR